MADKLIARTASTLRTNEENILEREILYEFLTIREIEYEFGSSPCCT
jgi:hypothetical protein